MLRSDHQCKLNGNASIATADISSPEASINTDAALKRGQYKVIRANDAESVHIGNLTIRAITLLIGCDSLDTVTIDRRRQIVMFVDDTGMIDGKPVNARATELYHRVCKPGTTWAIHGDVVIVPSGGLS